jgi:hypothetical protein
MKKTEKAEPIEMDQGESVLIRRGIVGLVEMKCSRV